MDVEGHTVTPVPPVQKHMCWTGCFAKIEASGGIFSAGNLSFKHPNPFALGTCQLDFKNISVIFWWDHHMSRNVNARPPATLSAASRLRAWASPRIGTAGEGFLRILDAVLPDDSYFHF